MADEDDDPDSWEDIDEEDLLRRLSDRQKKFSQQEKSKKVVAETNTAATQDHSITEGPLKIKYSEGTEYVAPIKILKRPDKPVNSGSVTATDIRPHKSLAQREAEYSSARARILGDNSNSSTEIKVVRQPKGPSTDKSFEKHPSS